MVARLSAESSTIEVYRHMFLERPGGIEPLTSSPPFRYRFRRPMRAQGAYLIFWWTWIVLSYRPDALQASTLPLSYRSIFLFHTSIFFSSGTNRPLSFSTLATAWSSSGYGILFSQSISDACHKSRTLSSE